MSVTRGWENGSADVIFFLAGVFAMKFLSPVRSSAARAALDLRPPAKPAAVTW
jgi:hypothetical protein